MAIESDIQGADSRLAVQFYKKSVKQDIASDEAGRPIFKEFDFVRIMIPGDNLTEIDTYAQESHKQRFPRQWAHYQNQVANHEDIIGTPLEAWPQITRSQAEELKGLKFHTVEAIAECSDQQLQRIGMVAGCSPHNFRLKAKAFLNLANESAEVSKREEELESLRQKNAEIEEESNAKIAKMQEQLDAVMAMMAESKPKGRKPKEATT